MWNKSKDKLLGYCMELSRKIASNNVLCNKSNVAPQISPWKLQTEFTHNDPISFIWIIYGLSLWPHPETWEFVVTDAMVWLKTIKVPVNNKKWKWILCSHHWSEHCFTTESSLHFKISLHVYLFVRLLLVVVVVFSCFSIPIHFKWDVTLYTGTLENSIQIHRTVMSNFRKWWNGGLSSDKTIKTHNEKQQCICNWLWNVKRQCVKCVYTTANGYLCQWIWRFNDIRFSLQIFYATFTLNGWMKKQWTKNHGITWQEYWENGENEHTHKEKTRTQAKCMSNICSSVSLNGNA